MNDGGGGDDGGGDDGDDDGGVVVVNQGMRRPHCASDLFKKSLQKKI